MKLVSFYFIFYPKHNQKTAGHSQCKSENINQRESFIVQKISPRYFKIVFDHGFRFYSVLKLFTGFANAALIACELTVINAIKNAIAPAAKNIHQPIVIL